jgi:Winged helix-turn helix/Integrase core domain
MSATEKILDEKLELLELAKQLGNVSKACHVMGYSRDSFYRFKKLYETGGEAALAQTSRSKPNVRNRVPREIEDAVLELALEEPTWGQQKAAAELKKRALPISPSGVRCIWLRHDLETLTKRLKALQSKSLEGDFILTQAQKRLLDKAQEGIKAREEFEIECPGYCGVQDTLYVGTFKGLGRIYQQTFIDAYSKVAFAKVYGDRTAAAAADLLHDRVLPFFDEHNVALSRVLTDSGTEYRGTDAHDYQLWLALENIEHVLIKAATPEITRICDSFHRTVLNEFYRTAFRKNVHRRLDKLQSDLHLWLRHYNEKRPYHGRWCYGKTPMQTFLDGLELARTVGRRPNGD